MALVDPITVAAHSPTPALTFARVQSDGLGSLYWDTPNNYKLKFSHSQSATTGEKHYMQLTQTVTATNPLTGGSALVTASASITFAFPAFGWTTAQKLAFVTALTDTLADADVTVTNLLNFNS
jgi:hypothetical protein